ncbi:MAG: hypothetical protein Q4F34_01420 [Prevotellaceae bacterium]|nr:hypothetical protein [Prevotellaceae bacterium]
MTKTKNLWIVGILAIVVGYFLGDFIGVPSVNSRLLSGDIAKADLYKGQKTDPEVAAIVEKLQNDTAFCNLTSKSLTALKERVDGAQELAERTVSMCSDVPEMQKVLSKIEAFQTKAYNAALSLDKANAELKKVANGENSDLYEQASNNAYICYSKAENQVSIGKEVFEAINTYLTDKKGPEAKEMGKLATDWSKYCLQDAVLNGNAQEVGYWIANLASTKGVISECVADMEKDLGVKLSSIALGKTPVNNLFSNADKEKLMIRDQVFLRSNEILKRDIDDDLSWWDGKFETNYRNKNSEKLEGGIDFSGFELITEMDLSGEGSTQRIPTPHRNSEILGCIGLAMAGAFPALSDIP